MRQSPHRRAPERSIVATDAPRMPTNGRLCTTDKPIDQAAAGWCRPRRPQLCAAGRRDDNYPRPKRHATARKAAEAADTEAQLEAARNESHATKRDAKRQAAASTAEPGHHAKNQRPRPAPNDIPTVIGRSAAAISPSSSAARIAGSTCGRISRRCSTCRSRSPSRQTVRHVRVHGTRRQG